MEDLENLYQEDMSDTVEADREEAAVLFSTYGTPFYAFYGILVISVCILKAFPMILLKDGVILDILFKTAEKHKVTHYEGGAAIGILMDQTAGRPFSYDISSQRYFGFGGSKVLEYTFQGLHSAFPGWKFGLTWHDRGCSFDCETG